MEATQPQSPAAGKSAPPVVTQNSGTRATGAAAAPRTQYDEVRKPSGYGLPCVKCHLYYPADMDACPICETKERVAPVVAKLPPKAAEAVAETAPDVEVLEKEREEFLRQFKSQLFAAHAEVANEIPSACNLAENHPGEADKAEICKPCYERLQERVDVCEGAFHMDLKEAAQIIYDAVWADPSDPSKTYTNAANALMVELRKRAGISGLLGPFQTLSD
jgi:hypothetical protein